MSDSLLTDAQSGVAEDVAEDVAAKMEGEESTPEAPAEPPEWLDPKYMESGKTLDEAIEAQAKVLPGMRKLMGGFTGAPEEYEFTMPEGVEGEIDTELAQYKAFTELAKDANMSNETANKLFGIFASYQKDQIGHVQNDLNAQKSALGSNADERITNVARWAASNLSEKDNSTLESMTYSADQIEVLERMIEKTRGTSVVSPHATDQKPAGFGQDDFARAVKDDRYLNDKDYRNDIMAKVQRAKAAGSW